MTTPIQRVPVRSSNIKAIGYDAASKALSVEFLNGGVYRYSDVPAEKHAELMAADSCGAYLSAHIKGKYPHQKEEADHGARSI